MKVKRLTITSFRGISDLTLEFHETEPTVFIGVNGVGKSSILDCLVICLSRFMARIEFDPNSKAILHFEHDEAYREKNYAEGRSFDKWDIKNGDNKTDNEITILIDAKAVQWSLTTALIGRSTETTIDLAELESVASQIRRKLADNSETLGAL